MFAIIKNNKNNKNNENSIRLLELFKERKMRQENMRQENMRQKKEAAPEEEAAPKKEAAPEEEAVSEKKINNIFFNINAIKPILQQPSELMLQVLKDHEDLQVKINNNKTMLSKFKSINVIKH